MKLRKLAVLAVTGACLTPAAPAHAETLGVCNEAENSQQGGWVYIGADDPAPPAFDRGTPMNVGHGAGTFVAAGVSPALRECILPDELPT